MQQVIFRFAAGRLPGAATGPQGRLLAEETSMFLEEIPREGVRLASRYRQARGVGGSGYLWIGRRRTIGRGEGRSGLRFDYVEQSPATTDARNRHQPALAFAKNSSCSPLIV